MKSTSHLHLPSTNKVNDTLEVVPERVGLAFWNWRKLSFNAVIRFLPVALSLFVIGIAQQSLAARPGNSGGEVRSVQQCLKRLGYFDGPVTGNFGPRTQSAVTRFQRENRLPAIGSVGPQTQRLLDSRCNTRSQRRNPGAVANSSNVLRLGSNGSAVRSLQLNLQRLGFYKGQASGSFGPQTQDAVIRFQRAYGIAADGVVGSRTLNAIQVAFNQNNSDIGSGGDSLPNALNFGDRGQLVRQLQNDLQRLGFLNVNPTGIFGPSTRDAVANFQRAYGLPSNGIADSQTLFTLSRITGNNNQNPNDNTCSTAQGEICLGERSQRVIVLQQRLQQWGLYRDSADGFYGPNTRDAVAQFQRSSGLPTTGFVDYRTWQALGFANSPAPNSPNVQNPVSNNRYVVVIPISSSDTFNRLRQVLPQAVVSQSPKGDFVNAGAFRERGDAERFTQQLRDRGFDARVEFF